MSFINEALKKAQKDRDTHYLNYSGFLAAKGKERGPFGPKALLYCLLPLMLILLVFIFHSWLNSSDGPIRPMSGYNPPALTTRVVSLPEPESVYNQARHFHKIGRLEDAKKLYLETLRLDPGYVNALNNLGVIYIHDKAYSAAHNNLEKAILLNPGYVDPYYNMACLHAIKGEVKEGLVYLQKAVSMDHSVRDWAQMDNDLANLRVLPEFTEIMASKLND